MIAGTLLPQLARRDQRLLASEEEESEDAELARIKNQLREWRAEAARKGKPLKLPAMPFMLRNIWCGAMVLFTLITFATFFITTVIQVRHAIYLAANTKDFVGNNRCKSHRNLLGRRLLGTFRNHHGGDHLRLFCDLI